MIYNELNDSEQNAHLVSHDKGVSTSRVLTEEVVSLLEERLMVNLSRRKVGEIVIRKEIQTHVLQVQVPVRREKLVVEQVSPEYKRLADIELGQADHSDAAIASIIEDLGAAQYERIMQQPNQLDHNQVDHNQPEQTTQPIVYGETDSPQVASDLLDMIAHMPSHNCETVRIELVLKDSTHQDTYQALFNRHCKAS
jgi:uncharacterized protein (TIGR02271 family)